MTPRPGIIKVRLTIAFDGTNFQGWQTQKTGTGVQQCVEEALRKIFPSAPIVYSSSRTDTGVHALGMEAHFAIPAAELRMPLRKVPLALNAYLPQDIRVLRAARAASGFHARFDAVAKQYRYLVWNHPIANPLLRHYAWHVPTPLDRARMRAAAKLFLGRHDFRSFAGTHSYPLKSAVRTVRRCDVRGSGARYTFILEADGFLYKMCRTIVGTLVQIGQGKIAGKELENILKRRDRRVAGMTAPAHGLVLWSVTYRRARGRATPSPA